MSNTNIHDALVAHKSPSPASAGVHFMHIKHRDGTDFPAVFAITCNTPQRHGKAERERRKERDESSGAILVITMAPSVPVGKVSNCSATL